MQLVYFLGRSTFLQFLTLLAITIFICIFANVTNTGSAVGLMSRYGKLI